MKEPSRQPLGSLWLLASRLRPRFRARPPLKLVALPAPIEPPSDPLRQAARDLVQAFDDFATNVDRRYDRAFRYQLGREGFTSRFGVPLARARKAYCELALASLDPFHEHLASLLESSLSPYWVWTKTDGPVRTILRNWLREEPNLETHTAEPWLSQISAVVKFAMARPASGYTTTLSLEAKQSLPHPAVLRIEVGTDVSIASVQLNLGRETSGARSELIWKKDRIWVTVVSPRLKERDRLDVTLTSVRPLSQSIGIRIVIPE